MIPTHLVPYIPAHLVPHEDDSLDIIWLKLHVELFKTDISVFYNDEVMDYVEKTRGFEVTAMFDRIQHYMNEYSTHMVLFLRKEILLRFNDNLLAMQFLAHLEHHYSSLIFNRYCAEKAYGFLGEPSDVEIGSKTEESNDFTAYEREILNSLLLEQGAKLMDFGTLAIKTDNLENYINISDLGYVYAVENKLLKTVKIGKSKQPRVRIKNIQNTAGCKDSVFISGEIYGYHTVELELHNLFGHKNYMNEWFNIDIKEASKAIKKAEKNKQAPTKDQIDFSKLVDRYNGGCNAKSLARMMSGLNNKAKFS